MRPAILLTLVAAPALAALTACGQPGAAAAPPPSNPPQSSPAPVVSSWPRQDVLWDWATRIEALGRQHPQVYAGVELDLPGDRIIVHRIPSADFDAAVRALTPASVAVALVPAAHSERQLATLSSAITADSDYWSERGVTLNSVGVAQLGQCVTVGVDEPQRHRAAILARYPGQPVCVEQDGASEPLTAGP